MKLERLGLAVVGATLAVFLGLPLVALVGTIAPSELTVGLSHPLVWPALRLSLVTTSFSLLITVVLGTPLSWLLAGSHARSAPASGAQTGRAQPGALRALETLVQLPIVVPPAVAGVALLLAFGRRGLFAGILYPAGWSPAFTTAAVVMAEVFVSAPFFVQAATSAFRRIDAELLIVARTLGASPLAVFTRVAVPLAAPGLIAGAAMSWARALGEFGATLMFAGNLEGVTQTLPLAIYSALESDMRAAQALSIVLVVVALAVLLIVRAALSAGGTAGSRGRA